MATLYSIKISNFRGIKEFEQKISKGLTCIIGRGDSGKSTVLDAISSVLSSSYSLKFYDSDFYKCDTTLPINIEATLFDVSEQLLTLNRYGTHVRGLLGDLLIDNMESEEAIDAIPALTIRLTVNSDLEPCWEVVSYSGLDPKTITASDRSKFNVSMIPDYSDKHFSLSKGNPLYSLFNQLDDGDEVDNSNVVVEIVRDAKTEIDKGISDKFKKVVTEVTKMSEQLGVSPLDLNVCMDYRDININETKVCLHENNIPLRLNGKGSKRLISLAILLSVANPNGVILIDEIELGLEPDRAQHLVRILNTLTNFQIIFTSHSRDVIVELNYNNLYIFRKGQHELFSVHEELQGCVRANPEAFFAKRLLICEGATEIGICRAMNVWREKQDKLNLACLGIRLVDGRGENMIRYCELFKSLNYEICLFCDSDVTKINDKKQGLKDKGIAIVDCSDGNSIEQQIFNDINWDTVKQIITYRLVDSEKNDIDIFESVNSKLQDKINYSVDWKETESNELRKAMGDAAAKMGWFKNQTHGEAIGEIVLDSYNDLDHTKRLHSLLSELTGWIDKK